MITKIGYNVINKKNSVSYVKGYKYSDMSFKDVIKKFEDSDLSIKSLLVEGESEYPEVNGVYSFEGLYNLMNDYDDDIKLVQFYDDVFKVKVRVYNSDNSIMLWFDNVKDLPETEIEDLLNEKKMGSR